MVENYKQWHEKLSFALLRFCTLVHTFTGATPYLLVYGTEVVISAKAEIPSFRIIQEAELSDMEWVWNRYEQLSLIDGKRMNTMYHGQLYQNRMYIIRTDAPISRGLRFMPIGAAMLKKAIATQKGKFVVDETASLAPQVTRAHGESHS
uniref:Uncharacterized protein LOC104238679 n=1 Tax=Nicotiana sylvestris TaxID=4096 RepID=A0A1U7XH84_NICSY|nr:PREDICTED: uncharacterized protein LOC104238679 [Nicotiana sylvestris]